MKQWLKDLIDGFRSLFGKLDTEHDHDFAIVLRRLRASEGGGYITSIPQLGSAALTGTGETPEEALHNLNQHYRRYGASQLRYLREELSLKGRGDKPLVIITEDAIGNLMHRERDLCERQEYACRDRHDAVLTL